MAEGGLFQLRWRNTDEDGNVATLAGGEVDIAHPADLFAPLQQAYTEKYGPGPEPS